MCNLYTRFVLWLIRPAFRLHERPKKECAFDPILRVQREREAVQPREISIDSLVFHKNGVVIENARTDRDAF